MRFQAMGRVPAAVGAGLALAACSTASSGASAGPSAPSSDSPRRACLGTSGTGHRRGGAADADDYLTLYTAGEFAIIYQMLSAPARQAIDEAWVAVTGAARAASGMSTRSATSP